MVEKHEARQTDLTNGWAGMWEPLKHLGEKVAGFFTPAADAASTLETYELNVELPGVQAKDVVIELHDHILTVTGEKHSYAEKSDKRFYFSERSYGSFRRAFRLPEHVEEGDVRARFEDGVLTISIPRGKPLRKQASRIPIES
jgi:HSP20 family protein